MAELHVECPKCQSNIVMKLQTEVFVDKPRLPIRPHPRRSMIRRLTESGAKVTLTLSDGTQQEVTSQVDLAAILNIIERERNQSTLMNIHQLTNSKLDEAIIDTGKRLDQRLKYRWALQHKEQHPFHLVIIRPLEKYLQLLTEEKERRTRREQTNT